MIKQTSEFLLFMESLFDENFDNHDKKAAAPKKVPVATQRKRRYDEAVETTHAGVAMEDFSSAALLKLVCSKCHAEKAVPYAVHKRFSGQSAHKFVCKQVSAVYRL